LKRVDDEITAPRVLLIGADGTNFGEVNRTAALQRAEKSDCHLVEVAPTAEPPVCRLVPRGQCDRRRPDGSNEQQDRAEREIRTLRFPTDISETGFRLKLWHGRSFLEEGGALEVAVRGEPSAARSVLERLLAEVESTAFVEGEPKRIGEELIILLLPRSQRGPQVQEST